MSTDDTSAEAGAAATRQRMDFKLEIVVLPVADVDRAKEFYTQLGWRLDADFATGPDFRVIQVTPPGSDASVIFGKNVTTAAPGSADSLILTVEDVVAARAELVARGIDASEVFHDAGGVFHHAGAAERVSGPDPERNSYSSWVAFDDPDGNGWLLQEITSRLPGRVEGPDIAARAELLRETSVRHGRFEAATPPHNWWDWYAAYLGARETGASQEAADAAADAYMREAHGVVRR